MIPRRIAVALLLAGLSGAAPLAAADLHVAPDGDNGADGSAARPWASIAHAASRAAAGDTIVVHGGIYRVPVLLDGAAGARSGEPGRPIRITAAPGEQPEIRFARAFNQPGDWQEVGPGRWATAPGSVPAYDVGTVWHDGLAAERRPRAEALAHAWDFWFDAAQGRVVVAAPANPATLAREIEVPLGAKFQQAFKLRHVSWVEITGLAIRYPNAHALQLTRCHHVTIRGCLFSRGGGALIWDDGTRYGNGVEVWAEAQDILVEDCLIEWFYDTGITNQGDEGNQERLIFRRNRIRHTKCGLEHWATGAINVRDVLYEENTIEDSGDNWAHNMQNVWGGIRLMRRHPNGVGADRPNAGVVERFVVRRNQLLRCGSTTGGDKAPVPVFSEHPSIRVIGGAFTIEENEIRDGRSAGIYASHGFSGRIVGNVITGCGGEGLVATDVSPAAVIDGNRVQPAPR